MAPQREHSLVEELERFEIIPRLFGLAEAVWPCEWCGFLLHDSAGGLYLLEATGQISSEPACPAARPTLSDRFEAELTGLLRALCRGHDLRAIAHSHPFDDAAFSHTDLQGALAAMHGGERLAAWYPGVDHLILAVAEEDRRGSEARLHRFDPSDQRFVEVARFDRWGHRLAPISKGPGRIPPRW